MDLFTLSITAMRCPWRGSEFSKSLSDFWLFNGAYMRLKNVALGYTLPQKLTEKISIKRARVYATGSDLFSLSKYPKDRDPEGSTNFITTSYVFGLSIHF